MLDMQTARVTFRGEDLDCFFGESVGDAMRRKLAAKRPAAKPTGDTAMAAEQLTAKRQADAAKTLRQLEAERDSLARCVALKGEIDALAIERAKLQSAIDRRGNQRGIRFAEPACRAFGNAPAA